MDEDSRSGILDRIFKKRKQTEEAAEQEIIAIVNEGRKTAPSIRRKRR